MSSLWRPIEARRASRIIRHQQISSRGKCSETRHYRISYHVPEMRPQQARTDAHRSLPVVLRMRRLRIFTQALTGRLLRILFLWHNTLPTHTEGQQLLPENSLQSEITTNRARKLSRANSSHKKSSQMAAFRITSHREIVICYTSRLATCRAFDSIKLRRGSTSSPIRVVNN